MEWKETVMESEFLYFANMETLVEETYSCEDARKQWQRIALASGLTAFTRSRST